MELEDCKYDRLIYDEACVFLKSEADVIDTWLYSLSSDCVACPYTRIGKFLNETVSVKFSTAKSYTWKVIRNNATEDYLSASDEKGALCDFVPRIGQFGLYELRVNDTNCDLKTVKESENVYMPLAVAVGIIIAIYIVFSATRWFIACLRKKLDSKPGINEIQERAGSKRRVQSIDAVRGISILLMIFVNDGAAGYQVLEHATWNGLLVGDLVFPCFMWIMGVCIPLSLSSQLSRGISRVSICSSIFQRSILLFFIGICLNTLGTDCQIENIRIFGVLQRLSISYLVTGIIYALQSPRKKKMAEGSIPKKLQDISTLWPQWLIILCIIMIHCLLTFQLRIPGCPNGYLGPGGRHEGGKYENCTGGAAGFIDRHLLGHSHIYKRLGIVSVYGSKPFDPEGILGCLTSIFHTFLGIQAGQILIYHQDWKARVIRWLSWALILGSLGAGFHFQDLIPVNKNLWSLSFVLLTTCFSLCLLTVFYLLIDVAQIWHGGPFRIAGMNALVMYMGHMICYQIFPFHWRIGDMKTHEWLLAESLWGVALWIASAYVLHSKRIYITL